MEESVMTLDEELARNEVLSADALMDEGVLTYEEYINELKEIDKEYGTHFYAE